MRGISALKFDPDLSIFHHDDDGSISSLELLDLPDQYPSTPDCNENHRYHPTPNSLVHRKVFMTFLMGSVEADEMNKILFSEQSSSLNLELKPCGKEADKLPSTTYVNNLNKVDRYIKPLAPAVDAAYTSISTGDECSYATPPLLESYDSDSMRSESRKASFMTSNGNEISQIIKASHITAAQRSNNIMNEMKRQSSNHSTMASKLSSFFRVKKASNPSRETLELPAELFDFRKERQNSYDDDNDSIATSFQLQSEQLEEVQEKTIIENMHTLDLFSSNSISSKECSSDESALKIQNMTLHSLTLKPKQNLHFRSQSLTLPTTIPLPTKKINRSYSDSVDKKPNQDSINCVSVQVKERVKNKLTKRALLSRLFSKNSTNCVKEATKTKTKNNKIPRKEATNNRERLFSDSSTDFGASYTIVHMESIGNRSSSIHKTPEKHSRSRSMTELPANLPIKVVETNNSQAMVSPLCNRSDTLNEIFRHRRTNSLPLSLSVTDPAVRNWVTDRPQKSITLGSHHRRQSSISSTASDMSHLSDSISISSRKSLKKRSHKRQGSISSVASDISHRSDSISVASSYVSYHDPCAKPSKTVKRSGIDLGAGDGDVWYEKIFVSKRTGKKRTFFVSIATGKKKSDEPPTGASKVLYIEDLEDLRDLNIQLPIETPRIHRFSSC